MKLHDYQFWSMEVNARRGVGENLFFAKPGYLFGFFYDE